MIILPNTGKNAELPIMIFDPKAMTEEDEELIVAMDEYPPSTKFRAGDLGYLVRMPQYLKHRTVARVWQVRFIISRWQYELMRLVNTLPVRGIDHAITLLDQQGFMDQEYRKPILYCHAFPHGMNPDSAAWMPETSLRRWSLREYNQEWETILAEAHAPYQGYDTKHLLTPYTYDLAPDLYGNGENLGRPFSFEEATVHTAALLGMEEVMFRPKPEHYRIDPEHDIFEEEPPELTSSELER